MDDNTEEVSDTPSDLSIIDGIYGVAQSGVQKVKKALGTVFELSTVMSTGSRSTYGKKVFKENMDRLREKLNDIPEEKVCEVPPEIGVPVMEKLTYVTNEQIREAYINLLNKASSVDTALLAHPGFTGIIDKLSTDEAKILKHLRGQDSIIFVSYKIDMTTGYHPQKKFATGLEMVIPLDYPQNIDVYLSNLVNIGLLENQAGLHKTDEKQYDDLRRNYASYEAKLEKTVNGAKMAKENPALPEEVKRSLPDFQKWSFDKGFFEVTPFGKLFINACVS